MKIVKSIVFTLVLTGCSANLTAQGQAEETVVLDRYQYIAEHLGLINKDKAFCRRVFQELKAYKVPVSFGIVTPLVSWMLSGKPGWGRDMVTTSGDTVPHLAGWWKLFLTSFGAGICCYAFCEKLGDAIGSDSAMHRAKLGRYLAHWQVHHDNTPAELVPLFDKLSEFYVANGNVLKCDEAFLESLFMTVSLAAIQNYAALGQGA